MYDPWVDPATYVFSVGAFVAIALMTFGACSLRKLQRDSPIFTTEEIQKQYYEIVDEIANNVCVAQNTFGERQNRHMTRALVQMHEWEISRETVIEHIRRKDPQMSARLVKDGF